MKISKSMYSAVVVIGVFMQLQAHAAGNAHKYPVVPKQPAPAKSVEAASPKATETPSAKPTEAAVAKPSEGLVTKPVEAAGVKPSDAASPKTAEAVLSTTPEKPPFKLVIVSRYEPLSDKDSLEMVPDLNRGRGKGK